MDEPGYSSTGALETWATHGGSAGLDLLPGNAISPADGAGPNPPQESMPQKTHTSLLPIQPISISASFIKHHFTTCIRGPSSELHIKRLHIPLHLC